jgi:hypothetical protein
MYLVLLGALPAVGLLLVWRNTPRGSSAFVWALLFVPVFEFVFGGAWFAVPDWLSRGPDTPSSAIPVWGVFVMSGTFSRAFCIPALLIVGIFLVLWRAISPVSFARLIARGSDPAPAIEMEGSTDAS